MSEVSTQAGLYKKKKCVPYGEVWYRGSIKHDLVILFCLLRIGSILWYLLLSYWINKLWGLWVQGQWYSVKISSLRSYDINFIGWVGHRFMPESAERLRNHDCIGWDPGQTLYPQVGWVPQKTQQVGEREVSALRKDHLTEALHSCTVYIVSPPSL